MTSSRRNALVVAISVLVPAIVITFTADHSALLGLRIFGAWAIVTGVVMSALSWRYPSSPRARAFESATWLFTAVAGVSAWSVPGNIVFLVAILGGWGVLFGILLGITWWIGRPETREYWLLSLTAAAAGLAFIVMPPNSIVIVGTWGAMLAVWAVWLLIAALSPARAMTVIEEKSPVT